MTKWRALGQSKCWRYKLLSYKAHQVQTAHLFRKHLPLLKTNTPSSNYQNYNRHKTWFLFTVRFYAICSKFSTTDSFKYSFPERETLYATRLQKHSCSKLSATELTLFTVQYLFNVKRRLCTAIHSVSFCCVSHNICRWLPLPDLPEISSCLKGFFPYHCCQVLAQRGLSNCWGFLCII